MKKTTTSDSYQQLYERDARNYHWYQCQLKADMRNLRMLVPGF